MIATTAVHVRPATPSDVDAIGRIEQVAFSDPWAPSAFTSLLGYAHVLFLVAERDERGPAAAIHDAARPRHEVVGYVVAWIAADEAEIANVAVAPTLRGRGVGAALLDAALDRATARGVTSVYLEVRESNAPARRLYESRRFTEVGRRRNYYRRPQEDALLLRRECVRSGG